MTSSSIILSNILATESCELRTAIDGYMDTKLKEFQEIMKTKVESVITDKIDKFYNKSFEDNEKVLFNITKGISVSQYNSYVNSQINIGANKSGYPLYPLPENKCFQIAYSEYTGNGYRNITIEVFKTFIMKGEKEPYNTEHRWQAYKHNLSYDCLFAIKHFQVNDKLHNSVLLLEEHPEYFKKNCSDFEEICRKEYVEIEKTKNQLKALMDENMSKNDYYALLDKKFKDFELEKKQLDEDKQKLKEEKEKMIFVKEKLVEMKHEVETEKLKIEEQKNKTIDIDKCFENMLHVAPSKDKSKVASD